MKKKAPNFKGCLLSNVELQIQTCHLVSAKVRRKEIHKRALCALWKAKSRSVKMVLNEKFELKVSKILKQLFKNNKL